MLILIICLPITLMFAQTSSIDISGSSSIALLDGNSICADEITVQQNATFTAEFYGDVLEGNCTTLLTPTGNGTVTLPVELTDIESLPTVFTLNPAYPNPFNPTTTIHYGIPDTREVSIMIYDLMGRKVATLFHNEQQAGWYEITWNGLLNNGSLASAGMYLYKITAADEIKTSKISLIK
ncbi:MAG: T9SS type A sorting domain-containing protein [Planctomycetia bacterium]|nr:T9SS type A sorting domain-containing protein [Planctomycetia bacterium]